MEFPFTQRSCSLRRGYDRSKRSTVSERLNSNSVAKELRDNGEQEGRIVRRNTFSRRVRRTNPFC